MSFEEFTCGTHRALVYDRGGVNLLGELTPLTRVTWRRIRDDISTAQVTLPTYECCELLGDLRTVLNELHILRNNELVWCGPITRLEYQWDLVDIFAEDLLWQAKRMVLEVGYDQAHPNIGNAIDRMDWLIRDQCYAKFGNPWNVQLVPVRHSQGEPGTARQVFAWQMTVWEDFDKYAEDYGADYCVIGRQIFYFDNHLAWYVLAPLDESHLSQFPRIVEYGNELATRGIVTNGRGFAGVSNAPSPWPETYGQVDYLVSNVNENVMDVPTDPEDPEANNDPTPEDIAQWTATAARNIDGRQPAPVGVVIPANTTLLPGAPWTINDLIPGAWFQVDVSRMCRSVSAWQRLHEIVVTEQAPAGEDVQFTAITPPAGRVDP